MPIGTIWFCMDNTLTMESQSQNGDLAELERLLATRHSLLTRLKDWDDQQGWKRFFDTYWKLIYSVAVKSGLSDAEAQDVVQETVLSVAKKMGEFKYDPALGSFRGWLMKLTRWRIADQYRKRPRGQVEVSHAIREEGRTDVVESVADSENRLESMWDAEWAKNLLDAALSRVKHKVGARQYQLYDLHVLKEWSVKDVTRTLGVSADQVYQAKSRISALIRSEVEQLEADLF